MDRHIGDFTPLKPQLWGNILTLSTYIHGLICVTWTIDRGINDNQQLDSSSLHESTCLLIDAFQLIAFVILCCIVRFVLLGTRIRHYKPSCDMLSRPN